MHLSPSIECLAPLFCDMASGCCVFHCSDCIMQSIVSTSHCQSVCLACDCPLFSSDVPPACDLTSIEEITYNNVAGVDNDNMATSVNDQNVSEAVDEDVDSDGSVHGDDEMMNVSVLSSAAASSAFVCVFISSASDSTSLTPINPSLSFYTDSSLSSAL
ncbi:hypothetical protein I7I48_03174 [Histoplasma ohiense]|nr:hypothetical protein I7I48_03174 [Histoplasma ohiense (nom. inval.)]